MNQFTLLLLTTAPEERRDLLEAASGAGFDVVVRRPGSGARRETGADVVAFDWSEGLPEPCADRMRTVLSDPVRDWGAVGLVHQPVDRYRCGIFQYLDDLVFPPYEPDELVARLLRVVEKRMHLDERLVADDLEINLVGHEVTLGERRLALTHTEFRVLAHLVASRGRVVTRDELGRAIWGDVGYANTEAIDVHVRRMRAKLRAAGSNPVETVRKVGYRYTS